MEGQWQDSSGHPIREHPTGRTSQDTHSTPSDPNTIPCGRIGPSASLYPSKSPACILGDTMLQLRGGGGPTKKADLGEANGVTRAGPESGAR